MELLMLFITQKVVNNCLFSDLQKSSERKKDPFSPLFLVNVKFWNDPSYGKIRQNL